MESQGQAVASPATFPPPGSALLGYSLGKGEAAGGIRVAGLAAGPVGPKSWGKRVHYSASLQTPALHEAVGTYMVEIKAIICLCSRFN